MRHIFDIERAVIRCRLAGKASTLKTEEFFGIDNAVVYKAAKDTTDILLLKSKLLADGNYEAIGGDAYWKMLENTAYDPESINAYQELVHQAYVEREAKRLGREIEQNPEKAKELFDGFYEKTTSIGTLKVWSATEIRETPTEPREDILEGFIREGSVVILSGDGGRAKSTVLLELAVHIVSNNDWLGLDTKKSRVLVVDAENDPDDIKDRLCRIHAASELDDSELKYYYGGYRLDTKEGAEGLKVLIEKTEAEVVVLDSFVDFIGDTDENSNSGMAKIMAVLRDLARGMKITIIVIHHVSKSSADTTYQSGRGASSIKGGSDADLQYTRDGLIVTLKHTKIRSGPEKEIKFELEWGTWPETFRTIRRGEVQNSVSSNDPKTSALLSAAEFDTWVDANTLCVKAAEIFDRGVSTYRKMLPVLVADGRLLADEEKNPKGGRAKSVYRKATLC